MTKPSLAQAKATPEVPTPKEWNADPLDYGTAATPVVYQPSFPDEKRRRAKCWVPFVAVLCATVLLLSSVIAIVVLLKRADGVEEPEFHSSTVGSSSVDAQSTSNHESTTTHPTPQAPPTVKSNKQPSPYSFDDIFDTSLKPRGFDGKFVNSDGDVYRDIFVYRDNDGNVVQYDATNDVTDVIVPNVTLLDVGSSRYFVSDDLQHVLLAYDVERVWRHSFTAKYKMYDRNAPTEPERLTDFPNHPTLRGERLQYARWSFTRNRLTFVYGNNLYFQHDPIDTAFQVTSDGEENVVSYGLPDWNYEEDVLQSADGQYWAPGGNRLIYVRFDVTDVPLIKVHLHMNKSQIYNDFMEIPYPKAGDTRNGQPGPNSKVQLYVMDAAAPAVPRSIPPPADFVDIDHYYTRVAWQDNNNILVTWVNRVQNRSITTLCYIGSIAECVENHEMVYTNGWTEVPHPKPIFTDDGDNYVTILPKDVSGDTWRHLASVSAPETGAGVVTFLTDGTEEISNIVGFDYALNHVFYISNNGDPTERHLFRVGTPSASPGDQTPVCLSCGNPDCLYVSASFSATGKYYILNCRGPAIPTYSLRGIEDSKDVSLEDNADVKIRLDDKLLATRQFIDIDINGGYQGKAEVFFPPGHEAGNSHRLLHYVYAGPNSQRVNKMFPLGSNNNNWLMYLKSSHDVLVTSVDGRGTLGRSEEFKFEIYKKMGVVEVEDQITAGKYFKSQTYVDDTQNAAVFGWSYGGQTSSLTLAEDPDAFKCGIAIAPVTSKYFYDTAYSERYLGYAHENPAAYDGTDVMLRADKFRDKIFMTAHGMKDDNVHFMNYIHLVKALIDADVQFRQAIYPDENHYIAGQHSSRHLYTAMTQFLLNDCWGQ